jgi:DNA repair protein RadC
MAEMTHVAAVLRTIAPEAPPVVACPHCGGVLQTSVSGLRWRAHGPQTIGERLGLQLGALDREELHTVLLDAKMGVIAQHRVYMGNVSATLVRIGELFRDAVQCHASGVILVHNHPSGDPTPSPDDLHLTGEAIAAGRLLEIAVLDHIIVAGGSYLSLREAGTAFDSPWLTRTAPAGVPTSGSR